MRILAICVLFLTLIAGIAAAGKPQADKPITQELLDYDVNAVAFPFRAMDLALTKNGVNGDVSVLMANVYNGLTWGDRLLELHTSRTLAITFTQQNAVQPGGTRVIWFRPIRPGWELATSASVL